MTMKPLPKKVRIWEFLQDFLSVNLGIALYALGWAAFLLPYHITTGGMTGMFAILFYLTKFPMAAAVLIANAVLLICAFKPLGWKFVGKTAYAAVALSFFLEAGQQIMTGDDGQLIQLLGPGQDTMACLLGAFFNGVGVGLVFITGGSTGGWDIIAALINKKYNISLGRILLYLDFIVIGSCWPIFHDLRMVVFGYVTLAIYTYVIDMLINSSRQDIQFIIFTRKHREICDRIISETVHSATVLDGEGYYTHEDIKVVFAIVHKRERITILRMIHEIDPAAFVSQSRAEGVYGNGFNAIKP